jgi:galactokinase
MFERIFHTAPEVTAKAPGRVNLLGEHTDYNGGFVFPTPLNHHVYIEASRGEGLEVYAEGFGQLQRNLGPKQAGCVWVLQQYQVPGLRAYIKSDLPMGSGLSSSAALEVATLRALRELYQLPLSDTQIAQLAQKAEVEYVGVRCGIMDQMASSVGRAGYGLFLDTQTLQTRLIPLPAGYVVAVVDSGIPRRLAESGYNTRRGECEQACALLGIASLRECAPQDPRIAALPEPLNRRVRHVVSENQRVLEGIGLLEQGQITGFGKLMVASHRSLQTDYEVSIPELDQLVQAELDSGASGARLTGAGFGGATVALVEAGKYQAFNQGVAQAYPGAKFLA